MSHKDWRVRIEDMLDALEKIERFTRDMNERDFCEDDRSIDAVVRNLEILGEAAHRIPFDVIQRHPDIPWSHLTEARHILVHEYHSVDPGLIWATIEHDLTGLTGPLRAVLRQERD
ncbi:hypothetical protein GALL_252920 [mine drainage metagenome]|uniref:Protein containing DUF86 n=1 Tax=mine drainage metagenome TaxID=410659 RepID=A0A1J5RTH0_9ZZZZ